MTDPYLPPITLDIVRFIEEVEKRACLWNVKDAHYNDKMIRSTAWNEICQLMLNDWNNFSSIKKSNSVLQLQRKWKNLKDCFSKELSKPPSSEQYQERYIYFDHLQFLQSPESNKDENSKPKKRSSDDKNTPIESKLSKLLSNTMRYEKSKQSARKNDPDRLFLLSLLSELKSIPPNLKLSAKYEIMDVLRHFKINNPSQIPTDDTNAVNNSDSSSSSSSLNISDDSNDSNVSYEWSDLEKNN